MMVPGVQAEPNSPRGSGFNKQMFGAKQQIPSPGQCDKEAEPRKNGETPNNAASGECDVSQEHRLGWDLLQLHPLYFGGMACSPRTQSGRDEQILGEDQHIPTVEHSD